MKISRWKGFGLVCIYALFILFFINGLGDLKNSPDLRMLYNRAYQLYDNIRNGGSVFFYYNDFGGVGYGASFFYGYLTLVPFIPLCHFGMEVFTKAFMLVTVILMYCGVEFFARRFTRNSVTVGLTFMASYFIIESLLTFPTYPNFLAFGFSMFFLGYSVDFFRNGKNGLKASLMFFLVFNTHMISSLFSFLGCVYICINYWDRRRFGDYVAFAGLNIFMNIYRVFNMLFHMDALRDMSSTNSDLLLLDSVSVSMSDMFPLGGVVEALCGLSHRGYCYFNFIMLICLVIALVVRIKTVRVDERIFSLKERHALYIIIAGTIIAFAPVWKFIGTRVNTFFQFPFRYMLYFLVIFLIITLRHLNNKVLTIIMLCSCLPDLLLGGFLVDKIPEDQHVPIEEIFSVVNGEYLSNDWVWDYEYYIKARSEISDNFGNTYDYELDEKGLITVCIDEHDNDITLNFPKLYYYGYRCWSDTAEYEVSKGYSNFISVDIGSDSGIFYLKYKHPDFLIILFWFNMWFTVGVFLTRNQYDLYKF